MILNVIGGISLFLSAVYFIGSIYLARIGGHTFKNECLGVAALAVAAICFK